MATAESQHKQDLLLITAAAFLRSAAISMLTVLIGLYLTKRHTSAEDVGAIVTAGLAGLDSGHSGSYCRWQPVKQAFCWFQLRVRRRTRGRASSLACNRHG